MIELYVLINKNTNEVMNSYNQRKMGVFKSKDMAKKHAWRYGGNKDNCKLVTYVPREEE